MVVSVALGIFTGWDYWPRYLPFLFFIRDYTRTDKGNLLFYTLFFQFLRVMTSFVRRLGQSKREVYTVRYIKMIKLRCFAFSVSQMNLGINDFEMLMMVINDNLLEGQNGKDYTL